MDDDKQHKEAKKLKKKLKKAVKEIYDLKKEKEEIIDKLYTIACMVDRYIDEDQAKELLYKLKEIDK